MKPFTERNPVRIGVLGVLGVVAALVVAYFSDNLPIIGGGTTYAAQFGEVAGLEVGNEVRTSGVRVGEVTDIALTGDRITVDFRVSDIAVGAASTVSIEIKTLLGQKYLALVPKGDRPQDPDSVIAGDRTRSPFDTSEVLDQLGHTVRDIDTNQLADSFDTISETFAGSGKQVRAALSGLSTLSETVASRDDALRRLLSNTQVVTGTLAARDRQLRALIGDGSVLLRELQARKRAVDRMLVGVRDLSEQLSGVIVDNQRRLNPALRKLDRVAGVLARNQRNLSRGLENLAPFYRLFTNTLGNGRWFDTYVCGLLSPHVNLDLLALNSSGCKPPQPAGGGR